MASEDTVPESGDATPTQQQQLLPDEERRLIKDIINKDHMAVGDQYYLVSGKWFGIWKDYVNYSGRAQDMEGSLSSSMELGSARPDEIDNSSLLDAKQELKQDLVEGDDYELLPEAAWTLLHSWYGGTAISRSVIGLGLQQKPQVELYPITVTVRCGTRETIHSFSRLATFKEVLFAASGAHSVAPGKYDLLVVETDDDDESVTALPETFLVQTLEECQVENGQRFELRLKADPIDSRAMVVAGPVMDRSAAVGFSYKVSSIEGQPLAVGVTGLANLGNTCFMNSALQCLSNVPELTEFFVSDAFAEEINLNNPLGTGGKLAHQYGELIKAIWSGTYKSYAPTDFKKTLGSFAPQFIGYQQQDSQELTSFLLDGLHEDLNRVVEKPFVPTVESNGREDAIVAAEAWEAHLKRNQSKIVDLFHGQLKSTVVCPDCQRISITFDPFMYMSLPIPTTKERVMQIMYWPPALPDQSITEPTKIGILIPKLSTVKELRQRIAAKVGLEADQIVIADVYTSRAYVQPDSKLVSDFRTTGTLWAFGVEPGENRLLVHVFQRQPSKYSPSSKAMFSWPGLIAIEKGVTTNAQVHEKVALLAKLLLPEDELRSYKITYCRDYGSICGTCAFTAKCTGCEVPNNDELLNTEAKFSLGIDWDEDKLEAIIAAQTKRVIVEDESFHQKLAADKETMNLHECLTLYTQEEVLSPEDTWYCSACQKHQQATKKFDLWRLPKVLVVHLKRFQFSSTFRDKISSNVIFPLEGLDLSPYTVGPTLDRVYDLVAVSNHMGGIGGGHYTAYALNKTTGKWFEFNDRSCSEVSADHIGGPASYLLFYVARS